MKLVHVNCTRWVDAEGKRTKPHAPGARKVRKPTKKWYAVGDPIPRGNKIPLSEDLDTAKLLAHKLELRYRSKKMGLWDPREEAHERSLLPLAEHIAAWRQERQVRGITQKTIDTSCARLTAAVKGCRWKTPADITAEAVVRWLGGFARAGSYRPVPAGESYFTMNQVTALLGVSHQAIYKHARSLGIKSQRPANGEKGPKRYTRADVQRLMDGGTRGIGTRTRNYYLGTVKTFCRWLVARRRLAFNPVDGLEGGNPALDCRHARRALTVAEVDRLLAAALASNKRFGGLNGTMRYFLYATALGTGFRRRELSCLWPASFDFTGPVAFAILPPTATKNRQAVRQPLPSRLADALRPFIAARPADRPVWPGTWSANGAAMLRRDLEAAGIPYVAPGPSGEPLYCDFHSLRKSFISLLARSGVRPKECQRLARHSTITLTMDVYADTDLQELAAAVELLPPIGKPPPSGPPTLTVVRDDSPPGPDPTATATAAAG